MALSDDVIARIPNKRLVQLTNGDSESATTVNTSILNLAAQDTQTDFKLYGSIAYNSTNNDHIAMAIEGVLIHLKRYTTIWTEDLQRAYELWIEKMERFGRTLGGNLRLSPLSNSELTHERDKRGATGIVRPAFDARTFDLIIPSAPRDRKPSTDKN